jgi:cytochrome c-type biogenesis protein CcmH/NrfG
MGRAPRGKTRTSAVTMNATDLAAIHAELRHIVLILYVVGALTVVAVALAALRSYWMVKRHVSQLDPFTSEASDLLEKGDLEKVIALASAKLQELPNHGHARWYLARALYHQERFAAAIEEFERVRRLQPEWAATYIDPYLQEARLRTAAPAKGAP